LNNFLKELIKVLHLGREGFSCRFWIKPATHSVKRFTTFLGNSRTTGGFHPNHSFLFPRKKIKYSYMINKKRGYHKMASRRISMRKIREMLRLYEECGLSNRQIARALNIGTELYDHHYDE